MCCAFIPRSQKKQDHYCILKELIVWLSSLARLCIESREHCLAGSRGAWPKFMQFISAVDPASHQNFLHLWNPFCAHSRVQSCDPQERASWWMSHPWDFPRGKVFIFCSNRQCLLGLLWAGEWGAELCPPVSLWRCLFKAIGWVCS